MSRPEPAPTHPDLGFARDGTDAQGRLRTTEEYRAALRAEYARLLAINPPPPRQPPTVHACQMTPKPLSLPCKGSVAWRSH